MNQHVTAPLVELEEISIAFGGIRAVDGASIDLFPGEVVGLLGHNGAGKTTLMGILSGLHAPDSGQALVAGLDVATSMADIRQSLGVCPQVPYLHNSLCTISNMI